MKTKKSMWRGAAAATAVALTLTSAGALVGSLTAFAAEGDPVARYTYHANSTDYTNAVVEHVKKQGEEGFVVAQNNNAALPLAEKANVAVFGTLGYAWPSYTGFSGSGNGRRTLAQALADEGLNVNSTLQSSHFSGGGAKPGSAGETWREQTSWNIDKATTTGIVVLGRGGAEGSDWSLTATSDPLKLSANELSMIDYAREHCAKTVVVILTANAMELGEILPGADHEVDAICYGAMPNNYHYSGFARVLAGHANATGGMNDTFVYNNAYNPGNINHGQQTYANFNVSGVSGNQYNKYNVVAEGIYVGYKYYETRYYDSIANPTYGANDKVGSSTGEAWNYDDEVIFTFGHGLSYYEYTQEVTKVEINRAENGLVKATVKVTNNSKTDANFTAQLYVNRPYTEYDIKNGVEKSAIDYLNGAKVFVEAGKSKEVVIDVPTKYLASWDSEEGGNWLLDAGDYWFTAAAGAHEAVNNVLKAQGFEVEAKGTAVNNPLNKADKDTFSVSHMSGYDEGEKGSGVQINNVADGVGGTAIDINYYLPDAVTYLTRSDWKNTFPKNYTNRAVAGSQTEAAFDFSKSEKYDEWAATIATTGDYVLKNQDAETLNAIKNTDEIITGVSLEKAGLAAYGSYWNYIVSLAVTDPESFDNVYSDAWKKVIDGISLNDAAGSIFHGGSQTDALPSIGNPTSKQHESVFGKQASTNSVQLNAASNTILGCTFDPKLCYEWGLLEGEGDYWNHTGSSAGTTWGDGLNIHRTAYNGRNAEYVSEDPMLANRKGYYQQLGVRETGAIMGPKHMGFNTQETQRQGIANYMTEQTMRETDLRCYQGALSEGDGLGVMLSFSRIGATNAVHHAGIMNRMLRLEWGFNGIMTTDMGQKPYMQGTAMAMASVNQFADFSANDANVGSANKGVTDPSKLNLDAGDGNWSQFTLRKLAADTEWCAQARLTEIYEIYALAHTWNINLKPADYNPDPKDAETVFVDWNEAVVEPHECEDKCEECGKCLTDCEEPECAEKCEGHVPEIHECEDKCEVCGKCTTDCEEPECAEKCEGNHEDVKECEHVDEDEDGFCDLCGEEMEGGGFSCEGCGSISLTDTMIIGGMGLLGLAGVMCASHALRKRKENN